MMPDKIYLDYNATAPLRPGVLAALHDAHRHVGNPSSVHSFGSAARRMVEEARSDIAALLHTNPANIFFNSGATEANTTILQKYKGQGVLISATEHPSVLENRDNGSFIPVMANGLIDLNEFETLINRSPAPALVSVMMVNNETGVIQPVQDIAQMCRARGIRFHTDATQAAGRIPVNIGNIGCDYLTLSSHKIGGPQGIGALIAVNPADAPRLIHGGGQERGKRAGTENVAGITGFGVAATHAASHLDEFKALNQFQQKIEAGLKDIAGDVVIFGATSPRVTNTTCFSIPGTRAETLLIALDLEGIALSSGSACSSGKVTRSHVLQAMGVSEDLIAGALRISTGWATEEAHVERFLHVMNIIMKRIRA